MRLRHPYEQLLADKLRRLPVPDQETAWQQMKNLLDEADNRPGGLGKTPRNGWWKLGLMALLVPAGFWLYHVVNTSTKSGSATALADHPPLEPGNQYPAAGKEKNKPGSPRSIQSLSIDNNTTLYTAPPAKTIEPAAPSASAPGKTASLATPAPSAHESATALAAAKHHRGNTSRPGQQSAALNNVPGPLAHGAVQPRPGTTTNPMTGDQPTAVVTGRQTLSAAGPVAANKLVVPGRRLQQSTAITALGSPVDEAAQPNFATGASLAPGQDGNTDERFTARALFTPLHRIGRTTIVPDSMKLTDNTGITFSTDTKKGIAKAQREAAIVAATKKDKKGLHLDLSNLFQPFSLRLDPEPRWAAGIALNSGITINAQNRYNYNSNAKSGVLTDYIPSVYLQYHFNDAVYAQAEINFISPQFTPQVLVYRGTADMAGQPGSSVERTINLQKLYYFNLPFTLHYSPISNFYLSAGLRFSSFQSGLVAIQEKQYVTAAGPDHPTAVTTRVEKFRDDSIAAQLSPNEWRWQAGAEYYWNRFTLGLSYNQSLKKLFVDPASLPNPGLKLRNESLLLTLRYNLFESRKKGNTEAK